jgi:hypothetical protein
VRSAVDGHVAAVTPSDHPNQLLGYTPVRMNEPAAVPALPDAHAVHTVTSNVLSTRDVESVRPKSSLRLKKQPSPKPKPPLQVATDEPRHWMDVHGCRERVERRVAILPSGDMNLRTVPVGNRRGETMPPC